MNQKQITICFLNGQERLFTKEYAVIMNELSNQTNKKWFLYDYQTGIEINESNLEFCSKLRAMTEKNITQVFDNYLEFERLNKENIQLRKEQHENKPKVDHFDSVIISASLKFKEEGKLQQRLEKQEKEIEQLNKLVIEQQNKIQKVENRSQITINDNEQKFKQLNEQKQENQKLQVQSRDQSKQLEQFSQEMQQLQQNYHLKSKQLEQCSQENQQLQQDNNQKSKQLEQFSQENQQLQQDNNQKSKQLEQFSQENQQLSQEMQQLQQDNNQKSKQLIQDNNQKLEELKQDYNQKSKQLEQFSQENQKLSQEMQQLQQNYHLKSIQLGQFSQENQQLQQDNNQKSKQLEQFSQENQQLQQDNNQKSKQLEQFSQENQQLQQDNNQKSKQLEQFSQENQQLQQDNNQKSKQLEQFSQENQQLQQDNNQKSKQLEQFSQENQQLQQDNNQKSKQLEQFSQENQQLQQDNNKKSKQLEQCSQENQKLSQEMQQLQQNYHLKSKQLEQFSQENQKLSQEMKQLQQDYNQKLKQLEQDNNQKMKQLEQDYNYNLEQFSQENYQLSQEMQQNYHLKLIQLKQEIQKSDNEQLQLTQIIRNLKNQISTYQGLSNSVQLEGSQQQQSHLEETTYDINNIYTNEQKQELDQKNNSISNSNQITLLDHFVVKKCDDHQEERQKVTIINESQAINTQNLQGIFLITLQNFSQTIKQKKFFFRNNYCKKYIEYDIKLNDQIINKQGQIQILINGQPLFIEKVYKTFKSEYEALDIIFNILLVEGYIKLFEDDLLQTKMQSKLFEKQNLKFPRQFLIKDKIGNYYNYQECIGSNESNLFKPFQNSQKVDQYISSFFKYFYFSTNKNFVISECKLKDIPQKKNEFVISSIVIHSKYKEGFSQLDKGIDEINLFEQQLTSGPPGTIQKYWSDDLLKCAYQFWNDQYQ